MVRARSGIIGSHLLMGARPREPSAIAVPEREEERVADQARSGRAAGMMAEARTSDVQAQAKVSAASRACAPKWKSADPRKILHPINKFLPARLAQMRVRNACVMS